METLSPKIIDELIEAAMAARQNAYAPYSGFKVGAAILTASGRIFTGCNVENASYGLTVCAERNAVANAIMNGEREFKAIAIVSPGAHPATPCGACRQVLAEFSKDLIVILQNLKGERQTFSIGDLIPHLFKFKNS